MYKRRITKILRAEGYSKQQAREKIKKMYSEAQVTLIGVSTQTKLENKFNFIPSSFWESLPALLDISDFKINIKDIYDKLLDHTNEELVAKSHLRFFHIWNLLIPKDEHRNIIKKLISLADPHDLAIYYDVIKNNCSRSAHESAVHRINQSGEVLPLFSFCKNVPKYLKNWKNLLEKSTKMNGLISQRRIDYFVDCCDMMEPSYEDVLLDKHDQCYGRLVFLSIGGSIIAALKKDGEDSLIGLRTVLDKDGFYPLVTGGVYATTKEISTRADRLFEKKGKFSVLHLKNLPLYPLRFIGSMGGFSLVEKYVSKIKRKRQRIFSEARM